MLSLGKHSREEKKETQDRGIVEAPLVWGGNWTWHQEVLNSSLSYCLVLCDLGQVISPLWVSVVSSVNSTYGTRLLWGLCVTNWPGSSYIPAQHTAGVSDMHIAAETQKHPSPEKNISCVWWPHHRFLYLPNTPCSVHNRNQVNWGNVWYVTREGFWTGYKAVEDGINIGEVLVGELRKVGEW